MTGPPGYIDSEIFSCVASKLLRFCCCQVRRNHRCGLGGLGLLELKHVDKSAICAHINTDAVLLCNTVTLPTDTVIL